MYAPFRAGSNARPLPPRRASGQRGQRPPSCAVRIVADLGHVVEHHGLGVHLEARRGRNVTAGNRDLLTLAARLGRAVSLDDEGAG